MTETARTHSLPSATTAPFGSTARAGYAVLVCALLGTFFGVLLGQPPRTLVDLLVVGAVFAMAFSLLRGLPRVVWTWFFGFILVFGVILSLWVSFRQPVVAPVTYEGFEIRVDPRTSGMVRIQGLSIDGRYVDLRQLTVRGKIERFAAAGISSSDPELLIRYEGPYRHAHFDFGASGENASLVVVDRTNVRFVSTKARRWSDQRYYFSVWELGPNAARLGLVLLAAVGGALLTRGRTGVDPVRWVPVLALAGVFLAVFPGVFSVDSTDQYNQCSTGRFARAHPLASTLLNCAPRYILDTPALYTALQLAAYAGLIFAVMRGLERRTAGEASGRWLVGAAAALIAFNPVVLSMIAYFGKDVPFGLCLVLSAAIVGGVIRLPTSRARLLVLSAALSGVVLLRPNGMILVAVLLVMAGLVRFEGRGTVVRACIAAVAAFLAFELAARAAGIQAPGAGFFVGHVLALPLHTIGYAVKEGLITDPAQLTAIQSFAVIDKLRAGFNPYNFSNVQFTALYHDGIAQNPGSILSIWLGLVATHPSLAIKAALELGWTVFVPVWGPGTQLYVFPPYADAPYSWSVLGPSVTAPFVSYSWAPALWDMMTAINIRATTPYVYALLSPSTWFWLSTIVLLAWIWKDRRRSREGRDTSLDPAFLVASASCLMFMFGTGLIIPSPEVRYTWWIYPVAAMVIGGALASVLGTSAPPAPAREVAGGRPATNTVLDRATPIR